MDWGAFIKAVIMSAVLLPTILFLAAWVDSKAGIAED